MNDHDLLEWINKQAERTINKYKDVDIVDIRFSDIVGSFNLGIEYSLDDGVRIMLTDKSNNDFTLICWMDKGAVLGAHCHSDFSEFFKVLHGEMYEPIHGVTIRTGEDFTFHTFMRHNPIANKPTVIKIIGNRWKC